MRAVAKAEFSSSSFPIQARGDDDDGRDGGEEVEKEKVAVESCHRMWRWNRRQQQQPQ